MMMWEFYIRGNYIAWGFILTGKGTKLPCGAIMIQFLPYVIYGSFQEYPKVVFPPDYYIF